jgi:hypothetical protein
MAQVGALADRIKGGKIIVQDSSGDRFTPTPEEVEAAVFASICVVEPKLGEMQWLATLGSTDILSRLFVRILICNRDMRPEGYDQAISEAEVALDDRPFSKTGTASA